MKNIINKISPKIIDCTLRDGGYYNNWDFNIELIQKYINAVQRAGVDYIELGYRTKNNSGYFGPLAYTTEDFIEELNISKSIKLGVMINSSEFIQSKNLEEDLSLFGQANTVSNEMNLLSQQKSVDYFLIIENKFSKQGYHKSKIIKNGET